MRHLRVLTGWRYTRGGAAEASAGVVQASTNARHALWDPDGTSRTDEEKNSKCVNASSIAAATAVFGNFRVAERRFLSSRAFLYTACVPVVAIRAAMQ